MCRGRGDQAEIFRHLMKSERDSLTSTMVGGRAGLAVPYVSRGGR
jgi:hypothetical protein